MNSEQIQLMKKSDDSLGAAGVLYQSAYYGFAASRAYYAMFYATQELLLEKGLSFSKHSAAISAFGREFANEDLVPKGLHRDLILVSQLRQGGDYGNTDLTQEDAESSLKKPRHFIDHIKAYLEGIDPEP